MKQTYDFDTVVGRKNTDSLKYDFALRKGMPADILPLWVADMDFRAPAEVLQALEDRSRHGIFGYSDTADDSYFDAAAGWYSRRFNWNVSKEWLIKVPGVVFGVCAAIRALTDSGDGVLIQPPVYYPFAESVLSNGRRLVQNRLVLRDGRYHADLADFEMKIVRERVKLFILCSPHNPVGRVWTRDELIAMGEICIRHGVLVVSDEIHADFVFHGSRHLVFAGLRPEFSDITVTCTAPSKTFNLAALQIANIFISNPRLRRLFRDEVHRTGYSQPGIMGLVACRAAYLYGEDWLEALVAYLFSNLAYIKAFLSEHLPEIHPVTPEGTYLVWLDFRDLGLSDAALSDLIVRDARLWLDAGTMFGDGGSGFQRINIACPRSVLTEAMTRLRTAVKNRVHPGK